MFLRLVADSFGRRPRRKLLTAGALSLGMAVVTIAFSVSLDVGDRLAKEFRSLGANLVVTPEADSLAMEIGGVDYRPVNAGAYLPEADLSKIKTVFWHNNIMGFAPILEVPVNAWTPGSATIFTPRIDNGTNLIGTWSEHRVALPDGGTFMTGIEKTNPWWAVQGEWFGDDNEDCVVGKDLADRNHLKVGDSLYVTVDEKSSAFNLKVRGILSTGGAEDNAIVAPLGLVQRVANEPGRYRKLYLSAWAKPEDDFARKDPAKMTPDELERWSCSPYISSIAYSIKQALPGTNVRVIRRVAEGEGEILKRVQALLWLVTLSALLAAALAVGASSAASVIERRSEIAVMKALGAGSGTVAFLLAAEQLLLAFVGGGLGYALGTLLARAVGQKIFGVTPEASLLVLAVVLVLAACVTLLGSALPLRRAARYEPAPILRGE
jgi:putative ABC transport system permease protein